MLDPERAHELTLRALEANLVPAQPRVDEPSIAIELFGRRLDNPVGLAAGFDKNARVFRRMYVQGFGFVEIGGVTPRPQRGNPRPRVFRVSEDAAVINNMGFPNDGAEAVVRRLGGERPAGMLGINLASNGDSIDPVEDFAGLVQRFSAYADYLTLDVSCPNSTNGKLFLEPARLRDLMARLAAVDRGPLPPKLVAKLSPDIGRRAAGATRRDPTRGQDRRPHHREHHDRSAGVAARQCIDARRALGPAAVRALDRDARARGAPDRRIGAPDRPRRNRQRTSSV